MDPRQVTQILINRRMVDAEIPSDLPFTLPEHFVHVQEAVLGPVTFVTKGL